MSDGGRPCFLDWSPDGTQILFVTSRPEAFEDFNLLDPTTGKRTYLTTMKDLWGIRWIGEDKLLVLLASRSGFKLFGRKTRTWSDWTIEPKPNAISKWGVSP